MRVCQPRVTGGWRWLGGRLVSIVRRAGWNTLPLPLRRPAAHLGSPEILTFLPKGGQCLKMILSDFYIIKHLKKIQMSSHHPRAIFFFSPSVTLFCLCLKSRVCTWVCCQHCHSSGGGGGGNKASCLMVIVILSS